MAVSLGACACRPSALLPDDIVTQSEVKGRTDSGTTASGAALQLKTVLQLPLYMSQGTNPFIYCAAADNH